MNKESSCQRFWVLKEIQGSKNTGNKDMLKPRVKWSTVMHFFLGSY